MAGAGPTATPVEVDKWTKLLPLSHYSPYIFSFSH